MRRRGSFGLLAAVLALGAPALAEQIVYFTNGTTMPIRQHRVEDGMIFVDMGEDNVIGFPFEMVERIDEAGRDVLLRSSTARANKIFGDEVPTETTPYPVGGREMVRSRMGWRGDGVRQPEGQSAPAAQVETDANGMATYRPMAWSSGAQRNLRFTGHSAVTGGPVATSREEGIVGTSKLGVRHVLGGVNQPGSRASRPIVGLGLRSSEPAPPPANGEGATSDQQDGGQP